MCEVAWNQCPDVQCQHPQLEDILGTTRASYSCRGLIDKSQKVSVLKHVLTECIIQDLSGVYTKTFS